MHLPPSLFLQIDALVHQFKGSSASFGAHTMAALCVQVRGGAAGWADASGRLLARQPAIFRSPPMLASCAPGQCNPLLATPAHHAP